MKMQNNKYVVVTTKHRGVFFGRLQLDEGETVTLSDARNCLKWGEATKGFLGLAVVGPKEGARVGPAVRCLVLYGVTSVTECTDEARGNWEAEPWN